jgi:lysophospholipase L1-like esterase
MKIFVLLSAALLVIPIYSQQKVDCGELVKEMAEASKKLNDWPELGRYRAANNQVKPPKKNENRVVFIGDSITDLWDNEGFGGFFPGKPYINRGIGGQTTPQMLLRFYADVIDNKPNVVVILAGTNDISGNTGPITLKKTGDNISAMAELARSHGIKVVLSSVLPVSDTVRKENGDLFIQTKARPPAKIKEMNDWLMKYAALEGFTYLDYYDAMVDARGFIKDGLTFDGLHPNAKGYAMMTPLVEKAIQAALMRKK